ncbi:mCG140830 [Mus musculus]|nr:mCG140830 [Mus musculus]
MYSAQEAGRAGGGLEGRTRDSTSQWLSRLRKFTGCGRDGSPFQWHLNPRRSSV